MSAGLLTAITCGKTHFFFEIIEPESGKNLADGELGEVVFTTLNRKGMPIIRYRTGDMARFIPGDCPCKSVLRRMDYISGRISNTIYVENDISLSISLFDEALFSIPELLNYQLEIKDGGNLKISLYTNGGNFSETAAKVKNVIMTLPPLKEAFNKNILSISKIEAAESNWITSTTLKRQIIDSRKIAR